MSTKREKLITDLKIKQDTALHDFDEKIAIYLNRLNATDAVQTRTGWQPNKDMTQFIKLFRQGTCGKIIEAFKELRTELYANKVRLDDLGAVYNGCIRVEKTQLEAGTTLVKGYCHDNNITPDDNTSIVVFFDDLKHARRYTWYEKKQEWFFYEMNYDDMAAYFEFPDKDTK